jgi:hypothetical protein
MAIIRHNAQSALTRQTNHQSEEPTQTRRLERRLSGSRHPTDRMTFKRFPCQLTRHQRITRLCVDMAEWRVAVGVVAAFPGLAIGLQAVAEFAQQAGHRIVANPVNPDSARPQPLAGPQQWRLWITARGWFCQFAQIIKQRGIAGREFLPPAARPANSTRRDIRRRAPQFRQTSPAIPVMRDSADTPPHPADRASAAANRRQPRSSRTGSSAA